MSSRPMKLGVAALMAASMCASVPALAQTEYQKQFQGTELNVLFPAMPQFAAIFKFLPEFEEKYGIKLNVDQVPFDSYRQKSLVEMQQGTGRYDIFAIDVMWLAEYASAGFLEPMMKYVKNPDLTEEGYDIDDFLPRNISGAGVYNETLYCLPIGAGPVGVTHRADVAAAAGVTLPERFSPEYTTDYMMQTAEKVHNPEAGMIGYANMPGRWFWGITFLPFLYAFQEPGTVGDEYIGKDWNITINNDRTIAAIDYFVALKKFMPADSANWGIDEATKLYQSGGAFGLWNYGDFIKTFFEDVPAIAGKNAHLHTPAGPHGMIDLWFGSWSLGISTDSKQKEATWTFIQWITSKEMQERAIEFGAGPVRHSTYRSEALAKYQPWWVPIYEFMLKTTDPDERVRIPEWAEISDIMGEEGTRVWIGEIDSKTAAANMEKRMTDAMRRGGYYIPGRKDLPPQHWRDLSYYDQMPSSWK